MSIREIKEGRQEQGTDESIVYTLTTTPWGSNPINASVKVYKVDSSGTWTDVTSTVMPSGSVSTLNDVISLPAMKNLTETTLYRVEVKFTCSGNIFEAFAYIWSER